MKKTIFFAIAIVCSLAINAKQPTVKELQSIIAVQEKTIESLNDSIMSIPDTLCVTALDSTFCVPTRDAQEVVVPVIDYIKETNVDGWPKTGKGWLAWLLGLLPLVFGAKKLTAIQGIWDTLKPYLKSRLGLAVLFGGLLATTLTFIVSLVSKNDFNTEMLMVIWPWASLGASYLHNIKKKKMLFKRKGKFLQQKTLQRSV